MATENGAVSVSPPALLKSRICIIVGHYGSGKTEVAVNLALSAAAAGRKVMIADLDIVNPYFRSRERKTLFERNGIRLISSSNACADADLPSLPAEMLTIFEDPSVTGILDIGGDAAGARVLARYRPVLQKTGYDLWFVLNANRVLTGTPEAAVRYMESIEAASGLRIGGIVDNTHLCRQTTKKTLQNGLRLAEQVSQRSGVPVLFHAMERRFADDFPGNVPVFPLEIYMKKPWEE